MQNILVRLCFIVMESSHCGNSKSCRLLHVCQYHKVFFPTSFCHFICSVQFIQYVEKLRDACMLLLIILLYMLNGEDYLCSPICVYANRIYLN